MCLILAGSPGHLLGRPVESTRTVRRAEAMPASKNNSPGSKSATVPTPKCSGYGRFPPITSESYEPGNFGNLVLIPSLLLLHRVSLLPNVYVHGT
jgi:hypothetical protein